MTLSTGFVVQGHNKKIKNYHVIDVMCKSPRLKKKIVLVTMTQINRSNKISSAQNV